MDMMNIIEKNRELLLRAILLFASSYDEDSSLTELLN